MFGRNIISNKIGIILLGQNIIPNKIGIIFCLNIERDIEYIII